MSLTIPSHNIITSGGRLVPDRIYFLIVALSGIWFPPKSLFNIQYTSSAISSAPNSNIPITIESLSYLSQASTIRVLNLLASTYL